MANGLLDIIQEEGFLGAAENLIPSWAKGESPAQQRIELAAKTRGPFGGALAALKEAPAFAGDVVSESVLRSGASALPFAVSAVTGKDYDGRKLDPLERALGISGVLFGGAGAVAGGKRLYRWHQGRMAHLAEQGIHPEAGVLGFPILPGEWEMGPDAARGIGPQGVVGEGIREWTNPYGESRFTILKHDIVTNAMLRSRSWDELATHIQSRSPRPSSKKAGVPGARRANPMLPGFLRIIGEDLEVQHSTPLRAPDPVGVAAFQVAKLDHAVEQGWISGRPAELWRKMAGRTDGDLTPDEVTELVDFTQDFAKVTAGIRDPELHVSPVQEVIGFTQTDEGLRLSVKHQNLTPVRRISAEERAQGIDNMTSDERTKRMARLDYQTLVPLGVRNIKQVFEESKKLYTKAEWEERLVWYFRAKLDIEKNARQLFEATLEQFPDLEVRDPQLYTALERFANDPQQLAGVVAAISSSMPWEDNIPEALRLAKLTDGPSWQVVEQELRESMARSSGKVRKSRTFTKWLEEMKARGEAPKMISSSEYVKARKIIEGADWRDVVFPPDVDITNALKTRNFALNLIFPDRWFPVTMDRHALAIFLGYSLPATYKLENRIQYEAVANAYRMAAYELGMPPHVLQAITWEAWRRMKRDFGWQSGPDSYSYILNEDILDIVEGRAEHLSDQIARLPEGPHTISTDELVKPGTPSEKQIPTYPFVFDFDPDGTVRTWALPTEENAEVVRIAHPTGLGRGPRPGATDPGEVLWLKNHPRPVDNVFEHASRLHTKLDDLDPNAQSFVEVDAETFHKAIGKAKRVRKGNTKAAAMLTPKTVDEYAADYRTFLTPDGKAGFAIRTTNWPGDDSGIGDLVSVFNVSKIKGMGGAGVRRAIAEGATMLDAFELPSEGMPRGLPGYYSRFGFEESWRAGFDPDQFDLPLEVLEGATPDVVGMNIRQLNTGMRVYPGVRMDDLPSMRPGTHVLVHLPLDETGKTVGLVDLRRRLRETGVEFGLVQEAPSSTMVRTPEGVLEPSPRRAITITLPSSSDLGNVLPVVRGLDFVVYLDGAGEAPEGLARLVEHHYRDGAGNHLVALMPDGDFWAPNTTYVWVPNDLRQRLWLSKPVPITDVVPSPGGPTFGGLLRIHNTIGTSGGQRTYRARVEYADGDNFAAGRQFSEVEVQAGNEREARLLAEQMAYTPQPGKPEHLQITGTTVSEVPPAPSSVLPKKVRRFAIAVPDDDLPIIGYGAKAADELSELYPGRVVNGTRKGGEILLQLEPSHISDDAPAMVRYDDYDRARSVLQALGVSEPIDLGVLESQLRGSRRAAS